MKRSFWSLIIAQVQVLLNDNAAKLMLMALGVEVAPELFPGPLSSAYDNAKVLKTILATIIILPFVLFSPTAGWISDRFSKRDVMIVTLWGQLGIMALIEGGLFAHSLTFAILGLFLLGLQCAVFSPAKQGIIKEVVSPSHIGLAVGIVEVSAIASMLLGGLAGGWLYDFFGTALGSSWHAAQATMGVLFVTAAVALGAGYQIKRTPAHTNERFRPELLWEHFSQLKDVWREKTVRLCVMGISYFYGLAGALYLTLFEVSGLVHANGNGTALQTGIYAFTLGVGIISGSFLVTRLTTHQVEIGLIPLGSCGLIAASVWAGVTDPRGDFFLLALFTMGLSGALFVVPLNAYLQEQVVPEQRGRILSANNLCVNLFGIFAVIMQYLISGELHLQAQKQLLLYAVPTCAITVYILWVTPEGLLRLALGLLGRAFYRVNPVGLERMPVSGGVLLLPNHISFVDAVILQLACPRTIRFLVYDQIYESRFLRWGLQLLGAIPISPKKARSAIEAAANALAKGEVVCLFPEGALTRTSALQKLNRGFELILRRAPVPVQPIWLENLWGSVFSYAGGKFFWKWPSVIPLRVSLYFGQPQKPEEATAETVRRALYDLSEQAFQDRPELRYHVGYEAILALRKRFFRPVITDAFAGDKTLTGGKLLAAGLCLAQWLKQNVPEQRIGIVLPPGLGATLANLACALANKTAVNLNFTAGRAANEAATQRSGLRTLLTAGAVVEKVKDFPWPKTWIDLAQVNKEFSPSTLKRWFFLAYLAPVFLLRKWAGIPHWGEREPAPGVLFTSGSSGEPKGVVLSHRNLLANTAQIAAILAQKRITTILGSLPTFHSFGYTVTLWWPLLGGPRVITYPNALDTQKQIELIEKYKIELLISTPTFLRSFLKRARPEQLRSLKLVVTGAEKLPLDLLREFEEKMGIGVCEGYGMTEASPVVATNLPDEPPSRMNPDGVLGRRIGSVGRPVPGLSMKIRHPETDADQPLFSSGMLWLRGANIFPGYLFEEERTAQVLHDHWYKTGDIARIDEDGFLYIEGRVSRFSKIAGEMVPHLTVEQKIADLLNDHPKEGEGMHLVVIGVPDPERGENLVLLTTLDIDFPKLRQQLAAEGLPNLWIPKKVKRVSVIPLLATGKLDLCACQELAQSEQPAVTT